MLNKKDSLALIDIGSNSVRLCIYKGNMRSPDILYNKKFFCGLGQYKLGTSEITKDAEKKCINSIIFFNSILEEIKTNHQVALCTAAIRNASNKKDVVSNISKVFKGKIKILKGDEEAELSALGVLSAIPEANGVMIDMGGGSIELASIKKTKIDKVKSFPVGILNFEIKKNEISDFEKELKLSHRNEEIFYLIGGTFRTIARCFIHLNNLPLNEIHQLRITKKNFEDLEKRLLSLNNEELSKVPKVSLDRVEHIHIALKIIKLIFITTNCVELIYPRYGIREGFIYNNLSKKHRIQDPTKISLDFIAKNKCRFLIFNNKSFSWVEKKYLKFKNKKISLEQKRIIELSFKISDLGWEQNSKTRAQFAFSSILSYPLIGIGYSEKILIAYIVYLRHCKEILDQKKCDKKIEKVLSFLNSDERKFGYEYGCIIHFLYTYTRGSSASLKFLNLDENISNKMTFIEGMNPSRINKLNQLIKLINDF